jgi:hypothetical protein
LDLRKIQNLFFSIELSFTNIVPRRHHIEFQLANITGKKTTLTHITTTTQHNDNDNNDDDDDDDEDDDNDDDDDNIQTNRLKLTTTYKKIALTIAKTVNLPRGTSLLSSKSPKHNKQGDNDNHDDGNERTPKKIKKGRCQ